MITKTCVLAKIRKEIAESVLEKRISWFGEIEKITFICLKAKNFRGISVHIAYLEHQYVIDIKVGINGPVIQRLHYGEEIAFDYIDKICDLSKFNFFRFCYRFCRDTLKLSRIKSIVRAIKYIQNEKVK